MKYRNIFFQLLLLSFLLYSCYSSKNLTSVSPGFKKIKTEGRVAVKKNEAAEIYWPGSGFSIKFKGSELKAVLKDEKGYNYFNVVVDDSLISYLRISPRKSTYTLASNLSDTIHTVKLLKRADWFRGKTWCYEFQFSPGTKLYDQAPRERMIEFFGNSITVGSTIEDEKRERGDSIFTNNYYSYAAITARHFNAEYSCIASSGIGIMASAGNLIMPDIYDRLNPDDSSSKWQFPKEHPDIVVINLFQNDSWIVNSPEFAQFKRKFVSKPPTGDFIINAYKTFIQSIRSNYPNASIICALGSMDAVKPGSPWPGYIEKAVALLNDKKIVTHFFPFLNPKGHPKMKDHQRIADDLINFISNNINW